MPPVGPDTTPAPQEVPDGPVEPAEPSPLGPDAPDPEPAEAPDVDPPQVPETDPKGPETPGE